MHGREYFGALFRRQPALISLLLAGSLALFFALGIAWRGDGFFRAYTNAGSFYAIFPHNFLIAIFGLTFAFACFAITIGAVRFWRATEPARLIGAARCDGGRNARRGRADVPWRRWRRLQ